MTPDEKLIYMANQIARNFATQDDDNASRSTADHIRRFWDPRMRQRITELMADGGEDLSAVARRAVEIISAQAPV